MRCFIIQNRLYLNVPYAEKDEAKKLGAKWDPTLKKWYCKDLNPMDENISYCFPYLKWILGQTGSAIVVTSDLYILETKRICWRCKRPTTVVALGICNYAEFENDDGEIYIDDHYGDYVGKQEPIRLAWVDDESQIPPLLLKFIKKRYNVKMGYSSIAGKCFANHCEHCGSIQGNNYIFTEPDSPFSTEQLSPEMLKERLEKIAIIDIPLYQDLVLDWTVFHSFDTNPYWKAKIYDEFSMDDTDFPFDKDEFPFNNYDDSYDYASLFLLD